jgi:hypothetical protein
MLSIKDLKNKLYISQYSIGLSHNRCGPQGPKSGWGGPPGPNLGQYDQKMGPILGLSLNLRNTSKLNPLLGLCRAPRVQNWI